MPGDDETTPVATDSLFRAGNPIIQHPELLEIEHVPDEDRIVGREEEIRKVVSALNPGINGRSPHNLVLYGKSGTGKSLVSKHVSSRAQVIAADNDVSLGVAYVDCSQSNTETRVSRTLGKEFNQPAVTDLEIIDQGVGTDYYYNKLWSILDECYDVAVVMLDEIDKLDSDDILMQLSRAGESGKLSECKIGIIAISNKISYHEDLNERVKSSLRERQLVFPPYDANQLREIMEARDDAFHDGVLTDDVIPLTAAFAAQDHGDARKALDILRNSGELAAEQEDPTVTEDHVRVAREMANVDRFRDLLAGQPQQAQLVVLAVTTLHIESNEARPMIPSREIYDRYRQLAEHMGSDVRSDRRVLDFLKEQVFLDILGNELTGNGWKKGKTRRFYLLEDPDVVFGALDDSLLQHADIEGE